jgi:Xaa-Pro aminopeptidase
MKKTQKTKAKKSIEELNADPAPLKLDDLTRLRLLRAQAEINNAQTRMTLAMEALKAKLKEIDPEGVLARLQTDAAAQQKVLDRFLNEYNQIYGEIKTKLGIDLKQYGFDDETGVLHPL